MRRLSCTLSCSIARSIIGAPPAGLKTLECGRGGRLYSALTGAGGSCSMGAAGRTLLLINIEFTDSYFPPTLL